MNMFKQWKTERLRQLQDDMRCGMFCTNEMFPSFVFLLSTSL